MKKISFISIGLILLSSCSVIKRTTNNNSTTQNNSPKFLKGVWIKPESKAKSASQNNYYPDKINAENNSAMTSASSDASSLQEKYAGILNVSSSDIDNNSLFELIDNWWGTPYVYGGESKSGIDCSAFSQMLESQVYERKIPRTSELQYEASEHVKKKNLHEGDLVFFHTIKGNYITHVGVYLMNNKFVHASSNGVTISDLGDDYWIKTYRAAGRFDN